MRKRAKTGHGPRHVTPAGRSVFRDLFPEAEAEELEIRAELLRGLNRWLSDMEMTQVEAAKELGVTRFCQAREDQQFSMDLLVRPAARAGLHPRLKLVARRSASEPQRTITKVSVFRLADSGGVPLPMAVSAPCLAARF